MPDAAPDTSLLGSLRRAGESVCALAVNRLNLVVVELQQEKLRAVELLLWFGGALLAGLAGTIALTGLLAFFLWQCAGYWGVAGLILSEFGLCALLVWQLRRRLRQAEPFAGTVAEFEKDLANLRRQP